MGYYTMDKMGAVGSTVGYYTMDKMGQGMMVGASVTARERPPVGDRISENGGRVKSRIQVLPLITRATGLALCKLHNHERCSR